MRRKTQLSRESRQEAEWRGAVTQALKTIDTSFAAFGVRLDSVDARLRLNELSNAVVTKEMGETRDSMKEISQKLGKLTEVIAKYSNSRGGLTGRDKAVIYSSLLTAIGSIIVAVLSLLK